MSATTRSAGRLASGSIRTTYRAITIPTTWEPTSDPRSSGWSEPSAAAIGPRMSRVIRSRTTAAAASSLAAARTSPVSRAAAFRGFEHGDDEAGQPGPDAGRVAGDDPRDHRRRVERQLHDLGEQLLLRAEEVADQGRVDAGLQRDRAHRGAVVALLGELRAGGGADRLPGAAVARPPSGPGPAARLFGHGAHRTC